MATTLKALVVLLVTCKVYFSCVYGSGKERLCREEKHWIKEKERRRRKEKIKKDERKRMEEKRRKEKEKKCKAMKKKIQRGKDRVTYVWWGRGERGCRKEQLMRFDRIKSNGCWSNGCCD
ncbi:hypothetical protein ACLOJK_041589 [Asimina triloba]